MADLLVIGAQAAGLAAAVEARRNSFGSSITVVDKSSYLASATCGLPYFISGKIGDESMLSLKSAEILKSRYDLNVIQGVEVKEINKSRCIAVCEYEDGRYFELPFGKLIIATGARPSVPEILEFRKDVTCFTLRSVDSALRLKNFIRKKHPVSCLVLGGGFVGLEVAEVLNNLGINVYVVESAVQVLTPLARDYSETILDEMRKWGIKVFTERTLQKVEKVDTGLRCELNDGSQLVVDFIFCAIGTVPNTEPFRSLGLKMTSKGHLVVDEKMLSNIEETYAAGDCAVCSEFLTGRLVECRTAPVAIQMGHVAGRNAIGRWGIIPGLIRSFIAKVYNMEVGFVGLTEEEAVSAGFNAISVSVKVGLKPPYLFQSKPQQLTGVFNKDDGTLLGLHFIGTEGVEKVLDVASMFLRDARSVYDILDYQFPYNPLMGNVSHPLQQLARVAIKNSL